MISDTAHLLEPGLAMEQRQKSAVIRIPTTPLSVAKGCYAQEPDVRAELDACIRLVRFFEDHAEVLGAVPHG